MIDRVQVFRSILMATDPAEVEVELRRAGAIALFWQTWTRDHLHTWDRLPPGFFSMYYGLDSDRHCAIANAIRAGWLAFSFKQARAHFGQTSESRDAEQIWTNFGLRDGLCVLTGFRDRRSLTLIATRDGEADRLLADHHPMFCAAAGRLDMLLRDRMDALYKASRKRRLLSPAESAVVRAQIDFPHLTVREQADILGISPRTLQRRHADIARKLGVSTFPGAIVIALDHARRGRDITDSASNPQSGTSSRT
jgi:DNA-binding CsgD family transcriptional regulator